SAVAAVAMNQHTGVARRVLSLTPCSLPKLELDNHVIVAITLVRRDAPVSIPADMNHAVLNSEHLPRIFALGILQPGIPIAKRIVVMTRVPDRNAIRLPSLKRADRGCPRRYLRDVAAARRSRVLNHGHRMQIGDSRFELQILSGRRRLIFPLALALRRIIESP